MPENIGDYEIWMDLGEAVFYQNNRALVDISIILREEYIGKSKGDW